MDEVDRDEASAPGPARAGDILRAARDAHGLSLADVAARTRVPQRHLEAIEASNYSGLPSATYAVGFAKAYARAVGADEVAIGADVREEVARIAKRPPRYEPYVAADPSRVPSRGVVMVGVGVALAILILIGLWYATDRFRSVGSTAVAPTVETAAPVVTAPAPPPSPTGQVTLAATDTVWLRVYDAANKTLFLGTMKPGDRFDVPANADHPMINVGRPDKLSVTLNGSAVPALGNGDRPIKDVAVDSAAIAARLSGAPAPTVTATATPTGATNAAPPETGQSPARTTTSRSRSSTPSPRNSPSATPRPKSSPTADAPENLLPKGFSTGTPNP